MDQRDSDVKMSARSAVALLYKVGMLSELTAGLQTLLQNR